MSESTDTTRAAQGARQVRQKAKKLSPTQGRQLRRLNELRELLADGDLRCDPLNLAKVMADAMLWYQDGLDFFSFDKAFKHKPPEMSEDIIMDAIHAVSRVAERKGKNYRPIKATTAGRMIGLTLQQALRCDVRTMRPVDETTAEARARRVVNDRDRKRQKRAAATAAERQRERERGQRRRATQPGHRPHAQSLARTRPWEAEGISQSTWKRRRRAAAADRDLNSSVRLYLSPKHADGRNGVNRVRCSVHEITGVGIELAPPFIGSPHVWQQEARHERDYRASA